MRNHPDLAVPRFAAEQPFLPQGFAVEQQGVRLNDPADLSLWAQRFGVENDELVQAAGEVGAGFAALQEYLTGIPALLATRVH